MSVTLFRLVWLLEKEQKNEDTTIRWFDVCGNLNKIRKTGSQQCYSDDYRKVEWL
jgi:hypothetical protein